MPAASNGVLFSLLYGVDPKPMMPANFVTIVASSFDHPTHRVNGVAARPTAEQQQKSERETL